MATPRSRSNCQPRRAWKRTLRARRQLFIGAGHPEADVDAALAAFKKLRDQNRLPSGAKDIDRYQDLGAVQQAIKAASQVRSKAQTIKGQKQEGARIIVNTPDLLVIQPLTINACQLYGSGTRWCVSALENNAFLKYTQEDKKLLFIAINRRTNAKAALTIDPEGNPEYFNANDTVIEDWSFMSLTGWEPDLAKLAQLRLQEARQSEPYPVQKVPAGQGRVTPKGYVFVPTWRFQAGQDQYELAAYVDQNGVADFGFDRIKSRMFDPTAGPGEVFRIYATVMGTIADYAREHAPKVILLRNKDERRARIVERFLDLFAENYELERRGINMALYRRDDPDARELAITAIGGQQQKESEEEGLDEAIDPKRLLGQVRQSRKRSSARPTSSMCRIGLVVPLVRRTVWSRTRSRDPEGIFNAYVYGEESRRGVLTWLRMTPCFPLSVALRAGD